MSSDGMYVDVFVFSRGARSFIISILEIHILDIMLTTIKKLLFMQPRNCAFSITVIDTCYG